MIQSQVDWVGRKRSGFANERTCVLGDNDPEAAARQKEESIHFQTEVNQFSKLVYFERLTKNESDKQPDR